MKISRRGFKVGRTLVLGGCVLGIMLLTSSCRQEEGGAGREVVCITTGYCSCSKCCDWGANGKGRPVYTSGPLKGKPKEVGVTASGTKAHRGTVAARPELFKMGTKLAIPGYGEGIVEDVGGGLKGQRIDLWFPTHQAALEWGRREVRVRVVSEP